MNDDVCIPIYIYIYIFDFSVCSMIIGIQDTIWVTSGMYVHNTKLNLF